MWSSVEWNGEVAKEFRTMIGSETRSAYQKLPLKAPFEGT